MSNNPLVLSFDCGTQSTRALLFDKKGNILCKSKIAFEPYFSAKDGYAEQHAEFYWDKFAEAAKTLKAKAGDSWNDIIAVSVTTIRDTCVCVDKDMKPLRPIILWLDARTCSKPIHIPLMNKAIFKLSGMYEPVIKQGIASKCNWIMQNEPEIWEKTDKYLMFSGYLNYLLTGRVVDSVASMIGHVPFDYKNLRWQTPKALTYCVTPVPKEKLCELAHPGDILGYITKEAAEYTGIPEGLPLVAAGSDKGCETLGTGCVGDGVASLSFGTTATVQITTDKYVEPTSFMPAYPAMIKGKYNPETQIFRGYWMVTWFKKEFAAHEEKLAEERGVSPESILDEMLNKIPAGSDGLVLQPYWSPILKAPEAKGAVIGFSDKHTRAHLYKAIIEGIGYGLVEGLQEMERRAKYKVNYLTVSGGGSVSNMVCQMTADMFGLPVKRVQTYETSSLGAAMTAFLAMGIYKDMEEAQKNMVRYTDTFLPDMKNHRLYQLIYEKVYKKIYSNVKPLYEGLKEVKRILEEERND